MEIPVCTHKIGTRPSSSRRNSGGGSQPRKPEAILRVFVQKSGLLCARQPRPLYASRAMERRSAESGELRQGSQMVPDK